MDRHPKRPALVTAAALLPLAVACGTQPAGTADSRSPVSGVHWAVDSVTVDGTTRPAPAGAYAEIDAARVAGNLGCNHFGARADLDGDRIRLSDMAVTEMACAAGPMDFERVLARVLADGPLTTEVRGDRLTLTTGAGDTVRLTREADAPLYGTTWKITALGADGTAASLPEGADAHLVLDRQKHKVTGRLGCNLVTARATVRDDTITLGAAATTRMMCDASLMHTEKSLLRFFGGTVKYRIDHRTLVLTSANGEQVTAVAAR